MCGRYLLSVNLDELIEILYSRHHIENNIPDDYSPRFNISPGQQVLSIINNGSNNLVGNLHWGFTPHWSKDIKTGYKMINARAETVHEKNTYKYSLIHRRCIIIANGFYEWSKETKTPHLFQLKDKSLFSFAGLWTSYTKEDGSKLYSCTILTTSPNETIAPIHNRMPVILNNKDEQIWLNKKITDLNTIKNISFK